MDKHIIDYFHKTLGTFKDGKSPPIFSGPQPVSIERKHFSTLKNGRYVVCEKTDGVRNAIICTRYNGENICVLLNRALQTSRVNLKIPEEAYKGTILDGELVDNKLFMVYDAMSVSGHNVMKKNLLFRLEKASHVIGAIQKKKQDKLKIKLKRFFVTEDFSEFNHDYFPSLPYKTDGVVFTPIEEPVRIGTHETMFKWKPRDMNTIDFQVKDRGSKWGLYIQDRGVLIFQSELPKNHDLKQDEIVECQYMSHEKIPWWKPVGKRTDKHHPNNRRTFYRTLVNIREDIRINEFIKMFEEN